MKYAPIFLLSILLAPPLFADAGEHIIPAGSLIGCTLSEPKLSSRTTAVGDPILCQVSHSERYGRSTLPTNSYLVGRFEDYKDPGHFVGKGWMELRFDRMVIEPDTTIPVDARVVAVPGYRVDNQGRILGKGHAVRDAVLWSIPILWPIDLAMLPMRGPRPTLKEETRLTLKVMDDLAIPPTVPQPQPYVDPYGLSHRQPSADAAPPPPMQDQAPAPEMAYAPDDQAPPQPPPSYDYAQPAPPPAPMPYAYSYPPPPVAYGSIMIAPGYGYGRAYAPRAGYGYGYGYGPGRPVAPRAYGYGGYGGARPGMQAYGARPGMGAYGARPGMQGYGGRPGMQTYGARPGGQGYGARPGGGMGARGGGGRAYGR
jgi:hypothetical protein